MYGPFIIIIIIIIIIVITISSGLFYKRKFNVALGDGSSPDPVEEPPSKKKLTSQIKATAKPAAKPAVPATHYCKCFFYIILFLLECYFVILLLL